MSAATAYDVFAGDCESEPTRATTVALAGSCLKQRSRGHVAVGREADPGAGQTGFWSSFARSTARGTYDEGVGQTFARSPALASPDPVHARDERGHRGTIEHEERRTPRRRASDPVPRPRDDCLLSYAQADTLLTTHGNLLAVTDQPVPGSVRRMLRRQFRSPGHRRRWDRPVPAVNMYGGDVSGSSERSGASSAARRPPTCR